MSMIPIQVTDEGILIPKSYLRNAREIEIIATADYYLIKPKVPAAAGQQPPVVPKPKVAPMVEPAPQRAPTPTPAQPAAQVASQPQQPAPRRHPLQRATARPHNPASATEAAKLLANEADRRNFTLQTNKQDKDFDLQA